jgi:hypothetical protein
MWKLTLSYGILGFLLRILWYSQSGDRSQGNLVKFVCIVDMKVGGKKAFYIFGYLLELIIKIWRFEKGGFWNLADLDYFFH